MTPIYLEDTPFSYDRETKTFFMSERDVPMFATEYLLRSPSGGFRTLMFSHSTGPEFDPQTEYHYKSHDGFTLVVSNDEEITKIRGELYLKGKLNK